MGQHGKYTNSIQVAADMDAIRKDLGQATLNFWGLSYGGVLGHTYAVLFPDRVGRVILDGSTPGTGSDLVISMSLMTKSPTTI
jgi:pimeloyl-ACP methyl ester carboxylesterase